MTGEKTKYGKIFTVVLIIAILGGGYLWQSFQKENPLEKFASGNGRLEATEVDITAKIGGRLASVAVKEGDTVKINQMLAQIETKELNAQLRRAEAEVRRSNQGKNFAIAIIAQRKSELSLTQKDLERSKGLYESDNISLEQLQRDETAVQTAKATLAASNAQLSNSEAVIEVAQANVELLRVQLEDSILKSPINGRVLYRLKEPGEVLAAGGKMFTVLDPLDVYMTIFLPTQFAAKVAIAAEARIILDGLPDTVIPALVSFVAPRAQFTPKEVETRTEREKLMFRVKLKLDSDLLNNHPELAKTGIPGIAYIRVDQNTQWPEHLQKAPKK